MKNVVGTSVVPRPAALLLTLASAVAMASLAACGQKGPLVPPAAGTTKAASPAPAASANPVGVR